MMKVTMKPKTPMEKTAMRAGEAARERANGE